jgi:hypothetical protein
MADLNPQGLARILEIFKDMSFEEAIQYGGEGSGRRGTKNSESATKDEEEEKVDWFEAFANQKTSRR